ncbi:MAG: hypothetical protein ACI9W6_002710 [Motiliproteus sp.]|jgi:hypothetical protein
MNIKIKQISRSVWLAGLVWISLIAGCGGSDGGTDSEAMLSPQILYTNPKDGDEGVAINSKMIAYFNEAMDGTTLTDQSFTLMDEDDNSVTGDLSYDSASKSAIFAPKQNLIAEKTHMATLTTTVKSALGTPLETAYTLSFTTGVLPDTILPEVTSTDPLDGATDHLRNQNLTAIFDEALDPDTVTTTSFTLVEGDIATGVAVTGKVNYINKVATFNPDADLASSQLHTATMTTAITDLSGNSLNGDAAGNTAADHQWSFTTSAAEPRGPAPVNLRTAGDFVILTKTGITNVRTSSITGDIGASPITSKAIHLLCSEMNGNKIYGADDAYDLAGKPDCFDGTPPSNTKVAEAVLDMQIAYNDAAGRSTPDFTELHAGDISGKTLVPGLYKWGTSVLISTDVTLEGGPNDVWIFQIADQVTLANDKSVILSGGALPKNIFWQVAGESVIIGTNAHFEGVLLTKKLVAVKTGATVNGRLLAQTAVTLEQNAVTQPAP